MKTLVLALILIAAVGCTLVGCAAPTDLPDASLFSAVPELKPFFMKEFAKGDTE